jgi:hypothetical protein
MRSRFALFLVAASSSTLVALAAACSSSPESPATLPLVEGGKRDTADPPFEEEDAEVADTFIPPGTPGRVYAHTTDTLYLYEPVAGDLKEIGKASCLEAGEVLIDLAVDRTGTMYATTFRRFLKVDPITATCTEIKRAAAGDPNYPNALSFVPAGTVDATKEALVGYSPLGASVESTEYVRVDTTTGAITNIGKLNAGAGAQYKSSGDLISLIQDKNRTFLTVKPLGDAAVGTDRLAEVDPTTGNLKKIIGDTQQTDLFGLGYWAGKGYGFSDNGVISEIDMATGAAIIVKTLKTPDGGGIPWYGAGVTTEAPITTQ